MRDTDETSSNAGVSDDDEWRSQIQEAENSEEWAQYRLMPDSTLSVAKHRMETKRGKFFTMWCSLFNPLTEGFDRKIPCPTCQGGTIHMTVNETINGLLQVSYEFAVQHLASLRKDGKQADPPELQAFKQSIDANLTRSIGCPQCKGLGVVEATCEICRLGYRPSRAYILQHIDRWWQQGGYPEFDASNPIDCTIVPKGMINTIKGFKSLLGGYRVSDPDHGCDIFIHIDPENFRDFWQIQMGPAQPLTVEERAYTLYPLDDIFRPSSEERVKQFLRINGYYDEAKGGEEGTEGSATPAVVAPPGPTPPVVPAVQAPQAKGLAKGGAKGFAKGAPVQVQPPQMPAPAAPPMVPPVLAPPLVAAAPVIPAPSPPPVVQAAPMVAPTPQTSLRVPPSVQLGPDGQPTCKGGFRACVACLSQCGFKDGCVQQQRANLKNGGA